MARPITIFTTSTAGDANAPVTPGVAVSGTNTYYSTHWTGNQGPGYGLQLVWTGTPTGTFTLWFTEKDNPSYADDSDWVQDTTFTPTNPAGSASKFHDDAYNTNSFKKRIKYVNASGSGTLSGFVSVTRY
jgi:hypothetical protein